MTEDWGAARSRARTRRVWKRIGWGAAGLALVSIAIPFVMGFVDGFQGAMRDRRDEQPLMPHIDYAIALGLALTAGWLIARHLRTADEFERRAAIDAFAVSGAAALALQPALTIAADIWSIGSPAMFGWSIAAGAGVVAYAVRRIRG